MNKDTLQTISSEALAARVVVYRSLGIGKELAIQCMAELDRRREGGDAFDYQAYIDLELAKLPKISLSEINQTSQSIFQGFNLIKNFLINK